MGGEGESPDTIIRQEPERQKMQNTGDGTQKGGGEDKEPYAKPKGRCGGLGVSRARGGDPDPGKTLQIRWCRRVDGRG